MAEEQKKEKTGKAGRIAAIVGLIASAALLALLLVHALICVFVPHYYPRFGKWRLFAVVTDSMEPEIAAGSMIAVRAPISADEIEVGTVITFEVMQGKSTTVLTHRVAAVYRSETGEITYGTRGDNAGGMDAVRPSYADVIGVYTGKKCGGIGYVVGFLQSAEGAVALILIAFVVAAAYIVVHFVGLVNVWRTAAIEALKKSGALLAGTQNDELGTIADVIGIVVKDPADKKDVRRKEKKLLWFLKTGTLPRRPYQDDIDTSALPDTEPIVRLSSAATQTAPAAPTNVSQENAVQENATRETTVREPYEKMRYDYSYAARIIRLAPQAKERYSLIKNELLSYKGVRAHTAQRGERFMYGRKQIARLTVRGKTLCLLLSLSPEAYAGTKFRLEKGTDLPSLYRISSDRKARYACELIADLMRALPAEKMPDYVPQDYYVPYEGVVSLMQRDLVRRKVTQAERTFKIVEVKEEE